MQRQKWAQKQAAENHKKTKRSHWKVLRDLHKSNSAVLHMLVPCLPAHACGSCATGNPLGSSFPQFVLHAGSFLTSMGNGSEFKEQILLGWDEEYRRGYWIYCKHLGN